MTSGKTQKAPQPWVHGSPEGLRLDVKRPPLKLDRKKEQRYLQCECRPDAGVVSQVSVTLSPVDTLVSVCHVTAVADSWGEDGPLCQHRDRHDLLSPSALPMLCAVCAAPALLLPRHFLFPCVSQQRPQGSAPSVCQAGSQKPPSGSPVTLQNTPPRGAARPGVRPASPRGPQVTVPCYLSPFPFSVTQHPARGSPELSASVNMTALADTPHHNLKIYF